MPINTDKLSDRYRAATLDVPNRRILLANLSGSSQELDLSERTNCGGLGRVRHFRRSTSEGWPENPLPIDPAARALGLNEKIDDLRAQVFQNSACNWRCWYCFVPFELLSANPNLSSWLTAADLVNMYISQKDPPSVLDLSGGQPELTPEWVPWVMAELQRRDLHNSVYLWSDDNLSTDYFWRYLSKEDQERVINFKNYGRVGCFKGFDEESFAYNTATYGELFEKQFELMKRYLATGIDMYAYVTLTSPNSTSIGDKVRRFVDRLQSIHPNLPLRTIPLEIQVFSPVVPRLNSSHAPAMVNQRVAIEVWKEELAARFPTKLLELSIVNVSLASTLQYEANVRCNL